MLGLRVVLEVAPVPVSVGLDHPRKVRCSLWADL